MALGRSRECADRRAGRFGSADGAKPVRSFGDDGGHVGEGLEDIDESRGPDTVGARTGEFDVRCRCGGRMCADYPVDDLVHATPVWGRDPGERWASLDGFEHRCLLAVEVLVGSLEDLGINPVQPTSCAEFGDGAKGAFPNRVVHAFHRDDDIARSDRLGGDERAFYHEVRVPVEDRSILEDPGSPSAALTTTDGGTMAPVA